MNGLIALVAQKIWEALEPWLKAKWEEVKPEIFKFIKDQFSEWIPQILKTIIVGMSSAGAQLTVNTADKVTEIIPGQVDDYVVDTIVDRAREVLGPLGIRF